MFQKSLQAFAGDRLASGLFLVGHDAFDDISVALLFDQELMDVPIPGPNIGEELLQALDIAFGERGDALILALASGKTGGRNKTPSLPDDCEFEAISVSPERDILDYDRHLVPIQVSHELHAIGSGRKLALGAMMAGASADRAVQIACQCDNGAREPVRTVLLDDLNTDPT